MKRCTVKMKLRKYQVKLIQRIQKKRKKHKHILISAPTGAGKTVMFATLAQEDGRILIVVPRIALIKQVTDTLMALGTNPRDISIHHGSRKVNRNARIHIGMINTLFNRFKKYGRDYLGKLDTIIVDEVHIGHQKGMFKVLEHHYWKKSTWLGFSATPMDNKGYLLMGYDHLIHKLQTIDLVEKGYLLPIKIYKEKSPDLSHVSMVGGEYNQKELGEEMEKGNLVGNAYDVWAKDFKDKKTMIFCVNIKHAEMVAEEFTKNGIKVVVSHSANTSATNDAAHKSFSKGYSQVLISINKLTAGFDEPSVEVLLALRPTKTKSLYLQAVGRVLRLHPSMSEAILIDCAGWIDEFGHPFERLSLVHKPQAKDKRKEGEVKLIKCISCLVELPDGLTIETSYTDDGVLITKTCPLCGALNDEVYTEYRNITELEIVPDPKQIETVKRSMVGNFVEEMRKKKGYKSGWTRFVAKDAVKHPEFMDYLKELRNEHKLGLININTALTKLSKERKKYVT